MKKIERERLETLAKNESEIGLLAKELLSYKDAEDLPELQIGQHWFNSEHKHHVIIGSTKTKKTKTIVTYFWIYESVNNSNYNEAEINDLRTRLKLEKFNLVFDPEID